MREMLARVLEEGPVGEAADRVLRVAFWSPRVAPKGGEVVDLASRRNKPTTRED